METGRELARRAQYDPAAMERLKRQYQPLVAARVMLHMGFYRPEYMEAGMEAVEEAVRSYEPEKGGFTGHLRQVLRFRLIDLRRRERLDRVVPESALSQEHHTHAVNAASIAVYEEQRETERRREEIEHFREELALRGLTLQEVADASPKHAATRRACRQACRYLMANPPLMQRALEGRIPAKELSEALEISPKTWERHRKYLVACAVAVSGEFSCIADYILSREERA